VNTSRPRYQIWESHPERADRLFAEWSAYAAAVRCITHEARDKQRHASPLAWSVRHDGKILLERSNEAWLRRQNAGST
jgi:hypothetical protein